MTKTSGAATITNVNSAADDLTVNSTTTGLFTLTNSLAEENTSVTAEGAVTITDLNAATDTNASLTVDAKGDVIISATQNIGAATLTTTDGSMVIGYNNTTGAAGAAGDVDLSTTLTMTTANGDIRVHDADDAKTLVLSATGDQDANATGADGDIIITTADTATAVTATATGGITVASAALAKTLELNFGQATTVANDTAAVTALTLSSTDADATAANATATFTTNGTALNAVDTITFTGSNNVAMTVDATDLVAAQESVAGGTTAAAVIATDNTTDATTTINIVEDLATGKVLDLSKMAVDVISINAAQTTQSTDKFNVVDGANLEFGATMTSIDLTAAANPSQSATITVNDDNTAVDATSYNLGDLTTSNLATVNLVLNDTEAAVTAGTIAVGTDNKLVVSGAADLTIATAVTGATLDASSATGVITLGAVNATTDYTFGEGDDVITATDVDFTVDGRAGTDTLTLAAADYSNNTLSISNFEVLDSNAGDATFAASQLTGESYVISGGNTVTVNVASTTGEVANLSGIANSSTVVVNGNTGNDTITGSATTAMTIVADAGDDIITTGAGADVVYSDNDGTKDLQHWSITASTAVADVIVTYAGHTVTYTGTNGTAAAETTAMINAINADATMSKLVVASAGNNADDMVLTALIDGAIADATVSGAASIALTTDSGGTGTDVAGVAGSAGDDTITSLGNGADFVYAGKGADSINLTETVSAIDTVFYGAKTDGSAVSAADATFTGFDTITGFTLAKDLVDVSAVTAVTEFWANDAATTSTNDITVSEYTDVNAVLAFMTDIVTNEASVMDTNALTSLALTFEDFTAVYVVDNDDTTVEADEIYLLGTVDAVLTAVDVTA